MAAYWLANADGTSLSKTFNRRSGGVDDVVEEVRAAHPHSQVLLMRSRWVGDEFKVMNRYPPLRAADPRSKAVDSMTKVARMPIRVVFYRDDFDKATWVAHCLEFDLMGHGSEKHEALSLLEEAIRIQLESTAKSGNLNNLFSPAPVEIQMKFAQGRDINDAGLRIELRHDDFEIAEADIREYKEDLSSAESSKELAHA